MRPRARAGCWGCVPTLGCGCLVPVLGLLMALLGLLRLAL